MDKMVMVEDELQFPDESRMAEAMAMERMEKVMGLSVFGMRITVGDHRMSVCIREDRLTCRLQ
jgi:hypothetical protein